MGGTVEAVLAARSVRLCAAVLLKLIRLHELHVVMTSGLYLCCRCRLAPMVGRHTWLVDPSFEQPVSRLTDQRLPPSQIVVDC